MFGDNNERRSRERLDRGCGESDRRVRRHRCRDDGGTPRWRWYADADADDEAADADADDERESAERAREL